MLCSPNPLDLRCSCLTSFSSRCFSLFRLSAIRSLNDLIFGVPNVPVVLERAKRPPAECWLPAPKLPARLRLTSWARRPLSIPRRTRAGLRCSSSVRRARVGEAGICTSGSGRGRSTLRVPLAVLGREEPPLLFASGSGPSAARRAFCSCLSFSRASIA